MRTSQQEASRRYRREAESFLTRYWGLGVMQEVRDGPVRGPVRDWQRSLLPALTLEAYRSGAFTRGGWPP